jgi:hypothetical protein
MNTSDGGGIVTRTASANPAKLEAAARAVPGELRAELEAAGGTLRDAVATFNSGVQRPDRLSVNGWTADNLTLVVSTGEELDQRLLRIAAAFRAAGDEVEGPLIENVLVLDDAALLAQVESWDQPYDVEFRQRDDGAYEVLGPDGNWYRVAAYPPTNGHYLGGTEQVVDFGNPDWGMNVAAAFTIGVTGGATNPQSQYAPPSAYEHIHFDENGHVVAGPEVTGHAVPPGSLPPGDAGTPDDARTAAVDASLLALAGLAEASKHTHTQYANVHQTQTSFYFDPAIGEHVAVVDAANIHYDNDTNEAVVRYGRLAADEDGEPMIVPPPDDPDGVNCPPLGSPSEVRIAVEDD